VNTRIEQLRARSALLLLLVSIGWTPLAAAQQGEPSASDHADEARRILSEAQAHDDAGRYALAYERYIDLYEHMRASALPRAAVALWNAGIALRQVPGREADARDTLQRFLDESTSMTGDPQVRDWRSTAVEHIAELDARTRQDEPEPEVAPDPGGLSPVGPIVLSIGGAIVVAGLVLGGVALSVDGDFEDMCPSRMNCDESTRSTYDRATTLAGIADAMWITGAVTGLVGLVLTFALSSDDSVADVTVGALSLGEPR
jgi:hypothetical protein